jgi:hypothetical protein
MDESRHDFGRGNVRVAINVRVGDEPLSREMAIAATLAEQFGIRVLLRGRNVTGGDALLTNLAGRCVRAEFKTLQSSSARAFERNVREASRQTGAFPGVVVIDAREVGTSALEAEIWLDRAIALVASRRPRLQEIIVLTHESILRRQLRRE